jgi:parallel beta-helix repeat protein
MQRNLFLGNDFSYASAHGLELTFSRGNRILGNRLVENAICGVWGGYSSDTTIASNLIARNGGMAYGLERGGPAISSSATSF